MRAVENALDDEQVAALFPFVQVSRDAVQHAEVRSLGSVDLRVADAVSGDRS
jgi:hypothetical protein